MGKRAHTDHEVHEFISGRWSPRSFADTPIPRGTIRSLFEAARWAPSAVNEQPWRFIFATRERPDAYAPLLACIKEHHRRWAGSAPLLMLTLAKRHITETGKEHRNALHDLGLAMGNLILQAQSVGLYVHIIGGFEIERAVMTYGIPPEFIPATMAAVGYLGKPEDLPEDLQEAEKAVRTRKKIDEFAFEGAFPSL